MKRKIYIASLLVCCAVVVCACGRSEAPSQTGVSDNIVGGQAKGDVDTDLCKEFNADFAYSATGKPIVKVEPSQLKGVFSCRYYTDYQVDFYKDKNFTAPGGPSFNIVLDNLSVETNKKGVEMMGAKYAAEPRIPMENYIVRRTKDNSIWDITLVINPNRFVWVDTLHNALTEEELINFAIKVAEKIQGKLNLEIKKNPVEAQIINPDGTPKNDQVSPPEGAGGNDLANEPTANEGSHKATAETFMQLLSEKKLDEAIAMMDANESTKQGWRDNFNQIKSLQIKFVEPYMREDWTDSRELYKFTLQVEVTPQGEQWGWNNGEDYRWVTVQNNNGTWQIHELANNP